MTRPEFDTEALYTAVDRERRRRRLSWPKLAENAGMTHDQGRAAFSRLGRGQLVSVPNLVLIMVWFGQTDLRPFLKDGR